MCHHVMKGYGMKRKKIEQGEPVEVSMTIEQKQLILEETFAGPDLTDRLKIAALQGKNIKVQYTLDELDALLGYIAAEANHTEDTKLQKKLDRLYEKLQRKMGSYDDGLWQSAF